MDLILFNEKNLWFQHFRKAEMEVKRKQEEEDRKKRKEEEKVIQVWNVLSFSTLTKSFHAMLTKFNLKKIWLISFINPLLSAFYWPLLHSREKKTSERNLWSLNITVIITKCLAHKAASVILQEHVSVAQWLQTFCH